MISINNLISIKNERDVIKSLDYPFVSIIIPAKNEIHNLRRCIDSLLNQNYPKDLYEILPVDDGSIDGTKELIDDLFNHYKQIELTEIDKNSSRGKLNSIDLGIQAAKGEIIITTDADVWMGPNWIQAMVKDFDKKTGMIIGIAIEEISSNPINLFQVLDGSVIRIISAALAEIKKPITCQGANLAFRKSAYLDVRDRVLELARKFGNREWLMQEINLSNKWSIKSQLNRESFVFTNCPSNWFSLINQRARWASTGKQYSKLSIRLYLTLIYFSMLTFILAPFIVNLKLALIIFAIKFTIDILVGYLVAKSLEMPRLLFAFPIVFILQPIMVVITAFLGSFNLYYWK